MSSTTTHTPGPWTAHKMMPNTRLRVPEPDSYVTAGPIDWPGNRVVAAAYHVDGDHAIDNARLIAAAPDMLEALERYVESDSERDELYQAARAAIRKARGE